MYSERSNVSRNRVYGEAEFECDETYLKKKKVVRREEGGQVGGVPKS